MSNYITTDGYLNGCNISNNVIYYKTDFLFNSGIWRGKNITSYQKNAKVLVIGHSDYEITNEVVNRLKHPGLVKIFAINCSSTDDIVVPIPLGITNLTNESSLHPIYGNTVIMNKVVKEPKTDTNLVYMNINLYTHSERYLVYNIFKNKNWVTQEAANTSLMGREHFLRQIRNHTFVVCPRGNGIDTHRLWETLYMGSIPIVRYESAYRNFTSLPILFVENWNLVTEEFLRDKEKEIKNRVYNLEKLNLDYWIKEINSSVN